MNISQSLVGKLIQKDNSLMKYREGNLAGIAEPRKETNMGDEVWEQINSPRHYNSNTMETIDLIRNSMKPQELY